MYYKGLKVYTMSCVKIKFIVRFSFTAENYSKIKILKNNFQCIIIIN